MSSVPDTHHAGGTVTAEHAQTVRVLARVAIDDVRNTNNIIPETFFIEEVAVMPSILLHRTFEARDRDGIVQQYHPLEILSVEGPGT